MELVKDSTQPAAAGAEARTQARYNAARIEIVDRWKSPRSWRHAENNPGHLIESVTADAFALAEDPNDREWRRMRRMSDLLVRGPACTS